MGSVGTAPLSVPVTLTSVASAPSDRTLGLTDSVTVLCCAAAGAVKNEKPTNRAASSGTVPRSEKADSVRQRERIVDPRLVIGSTLVLCRAVVIMVPGFECVRVRRSG